MKPTPVQFEFAQYGQLTVDILAKKVVSFVELPLLFDVGHDLELPEPSFGTRISDSDPFTTWPAMDGEVHTCILGALDDLASNGYGIYNRSTTVKLEGDEWCSSQGPPKFRLHHKIYTMRRIVTVARVGALVEDMDHLTMEE